jgi:predicted TIM-barrel fold metal-dependent hydrolase
MNVTVRERMPEAAPRAEVLQAVVDCDIHPAVNTPRELFPFMAKRWQEHLLTYGNHIRQGLSNALAHPRMQPEVARADSWPPDGSIPGSDPAFMRVQHLDGNGVEYGVLIPLGRSGASQRNLDYGIALCSAVNDWQLAKYCDFDKRFRASITVTQEDPAAAVAEIDKRAGDKRFVQVLLPPRSAEPLGRRRYRPDFRAAGAQQASGRAASAASAGIRPPAAAIRATTSRSTLRRCRPCRRSLPRSWSRACSSSFRACRSC